MQFFPCAMFCQNSSTFPACGNCPATPITAMAGGGAGAGASAMNLDAPRLRRDGFPAGGLDPISFGDEQLFPGAAGMSTVAPTPGADSEPRFSASSLT